MYGCCLKKLYFNTYVTISSCVTYVQNSQKHAVGSFANVRTSTSVTKFQVQIVNDDAYSM